MKKTLVMLIIGLATASYGGVDVSWFSAMGFYFTEDPAVGILGDATGNSTVAQLMYSPDNVKDAVNTSGRGVNNDVVWDSVTLTEDGVSGNWDDFACFGVQSYRQTFTLGYAYALIFQDSSVRAGDWYYYTPMLALKDITGIMLPQEIEMNTDFTWGNAIDSATGGGVSNAGLVGQVVQVIQVVPEPASVMMVGLGGLLLVGYRRFYGRW
ncbi:MAG: PEP-CTERM sorting domain-containing protein [Kiritimatiellales bacterium]